MFVEVTNMAKNQAFASIGTFRMDRAHRELQKRVLEERIAPTVARMRGFVTAFWCEDEPAGLSHHYAVFEDENGVRALHAHIESEREQALRAGVELISLSTLPVSALARA